MVSDFAWARDLISRGGCPICESEIWMDTYGNRPGRVAYPLAMAYLLRGSTCFLMFVRPIILQAIYLECMKAIRR